MRIMDVTASARLLKKMIHISLAVIIVVYQMDFGILENTDSISEHINNESNPS